VKSLLNKPLINIHALLRVIGLLLTIEAAFMLLPIIACLIYGESDWLPFTYTCIGTGAIGAWLYFGIKPKYSTMGKRDGFLLTASVWAIFSLFGMIPFIFSSCPLSVSDAYFEAMSGFTTTGASVIPRMEDVSHGILLWRSIMQWIGGMGIILFTLAVIPMLNHSGAVQMFNAEVTGITHDKIRPRIGQTAKSLWLIYIALTVIMIGLLWIGPMNFFESLCHSLSTISTGGFSTRSDSIAAWDSLYVKIIVLVFMFLGGVNFTLIYKAISGEIRELWKNDVLRTYCFTVLTAWVLFMGSMLLHGTYTDSENLIVDSVFQVVSTITSSGFTVCNFEAWGYFVIAIIFILMFTGSCAGSTSGGSKLDRSLYLVKNTYNELYRCIHPNAIMSVHINGRVVSSDLVNKVIAFLCIYIMLIGAGGLILTAYGVTIDDALFASFSCVGNTGLGCGIFGINGSYAVLPAICKWVLATLMMIGRLELFTVLVLFTPAFWHR
jgi:trk system potassium uptake protein TrkH